METINSTEAKETAKAKVKSFFARPGIQLTTEVAGAIALVAVGAFFGYRSGKKTGEATGQVKGYAHALDEIGVSPAEVPTMAAAWAESKREMANAIDQAAALAPATA